MKKGLFFSFGLLCMLLSNTSFSTAAAQGVTRIFVSPGGSANASGSKKDPLNTISAALEMAEKVSRKNPRSMEILLREGTYFLDRTLEVVQGKTWNSSVPLTIVAYKKEKAVLHGGSIIAPELLKPVSDKNLAARFLPEARSRIRQISLTDAGITNTGKLHAFGFSRPMAPSWLEIFVNSKPGTLARWPNEGTVLIKSVLDTGSIPRWGDKSNRGGKFTYAATKRPSRWKNPGKAWIAGYFMWGYADDAAQLKSIDTIKSVISTQTPSYYGFGNGKPWRAWYAYNLPEEIDLPGEYYVDVESKMLYFMPPDSLKKVEISVLETPMMAMEGISNVSLKNIDFSCSRGMGISMERTTGVLIDGCTFSNLGMMAIYMGKGIQPEDPTSNAGGTPASRTAGNIVQYVYEHSTFDREAGTKNGIINCEIFNTGSGGIYMSGGNRLTLEPGDNYVDNCKVHDFTRIEKTYRPGIWITGVGNRISHCDVYNSPSVGIFLHGNNHLIEYNNLHHLDTDADDMGALYFGRNPSELGNVTRYNYFHDIGGEHKTMAIYHDDGACGMQVYDNIFYKAGTVAGFIGGGRDNVYTNNIFIYTKFAAHIDDRLKNWARAMLLKDGLYQQRLEAVNFKQAPYSVQYPNLAKYWEDDPASPKRNTFSRNLLVNIQQVAEGQPEWLPYLNDNYETKKDPGFKDYTEKDFRLSRKSEVWKKIPGFRAIPLKKIGYRPDHQKHKAG
ncbi:right-handed parallel beta-helix repeat-containing protein [Pedobacter hartonius]|uniref:Right handed beta helix region n=1 Tax=Pedobacter hartonius TaxID=425514 RepID=A0A1H4DT31_9SPHI|nr:right-handed parallel beta-helix repeat-containing protein [Pedobacter hartonius]SEA75669.1 Right handed beta helix region [Pedobacter hartonius]